MTRNESVIWMTAALLMALFLSSSCGAAYFSAKTIATYSILPDGTLQASYDSSKDQQGLDLDVESANGHIKTVKIHADRASTNESAIAAALEANLKLIALVQALATAAGSAPKGLTVPNGPVQ